MRIISSKLAPRGGPEGANRQPHSEQPKPTKLGCSTQSSFRLMGLCRCSPTLSDCVLVPARRQGTKASSSRSGVLPQVQQKTVSQSWPGERCTKWMGEAYTCHFGWSVGHPTEREMFGSCERLDFGGRFRVKRERSSVGPVLVPFRASRSLLVAAVMPM